MRPGHEAPEYLPERLKERVGVCGFNEAGARDPGIRVDLRLQLPERLASMRPGHEAPEYLPALNNFLEQWKLQ